MIRDVPRETWRDELDSFSRQHEGWLVSVTTCNADGQVFIEAQDLPLQGISQTTPHAADVAVAVGDREHHVTHEVRGVTAMQIDLTDTRAERALIIESADRTKTTVTFRSPMRPEDVDGLPFNRST
ncbi:MAG TPA: DUF5335 family protein [Vicinamibacterales bacterium]|nr:DUF5335 family protein [Vicinamibacterales bacterium]